MLDCLYILQDDTRSIKYQVKSIKLTEFRQEIHVVRNLKILALSDRRNAASPFRKERFVFVQHDLVERVRGNE